MRTAQCTSKPSSAAEKRRSFFSKSASHYSLFARVARGRRGFVAALLRGALVDVAVAAQPGDGAIAHAAHELVEIVLRGRRCLVERGGAALVAKAARPGGVDCKTGRATTSSCAKKIAYDFGGEPDERSIATWLAEQ